MSPEIYMSKSQPLSTTPNVTVFGDGGSESFQVGAHVEMGGGAPGEGMEALQPFCIPCTLHLFYLSVPELCPFITNW